MKQLDMSILYTKARYITYMKRPIILVIAIFISICQQAHSNRYDNSFTKVENIVHTLPNFFCNEYFF
ncbi:MAG: hypothetical protein H6Q13_389 [Bacteroidetes bacterium]|nr:hypothetical protein [Bacteroidota bacterium]